MPMKIVRMDELLDHQHDMLRTWTLEHTACSVCGQSFTPTEWDNRHTDDDGEDCHERCCPMCNGNEQAEIPLAAIRILAEHAAPSTQYAHYHKPELCAVARHVLGWLDSAEESQS